MQSPNAITDRPAVHSAFGRVAVVMGGWSAEREISLKSGNQILQSLLASGVDAHGVDADKNIVNTLKAGAFDRAFLILHGRGGEDGELQGALELAGIPYTGSGVLASAIAMDKLRAKKLVEVAGVRTPEWRDARTVEEALQAAEQLGFPVIVKPVFEGSSLGVSKAMENQVSDAFEEASQYGQVILEKFIPGKEVTAAILGEEALPLVSMSTPNMFYDYRAKYFDDTTVYECPCDLAPEVEARIKQSARTAFNALGARHWGRIDFMLDENDQEYFIELNTAPGMTDHSLVPMAASAAGVDFSDLCLSILQMTVDESEVLP